MEEEYRKEQQNIHASSELTARTKEAMRREEERLRQDRRRRRNIGARVGAAAAVFVLVLVAFPFLESQNSLTGKKEEKAEQGMYLEKEEKKPVKLPVNAENKTEEKAEDGSFRVEQAKQPPEEPEETQKEERNVCEIPVTLWMDERTGYLTACFRIKDALYVATGGKMDKEAFLEKVEEFIRSRQ